MIERSDLLGSVVRCAPRRNRHRGPGCPSREVIGAAGLVLLGVAWSVLSLCW